MPGRQLLAAAGAEVLGVYGSGALAWVTKKSGRGRGFCIGALPVLPQGSGGPHTATWMREYLDHDPVAEAIITRPLRDAGIAPDDTVNHRGVITNRLESDRSTVITVVNLDLEADGTLKNVELRVAGGKPVKRAWSCFYAKDNLLGGVADGTAVVTLPTLGPADVLVLEH